MGPCSYFRCIDGQTIEDIHDQIDSKADDLQGYQRYPIQVIEITSNISLRYFALYRVANTREPTWLGLLSEFTGVNHSTRQPGRFHSALIVVEYGGHIYILTYGSAHNVARQLRIEHRFGKTVVSNGKNQDEVRQITSRSTGSYSKQRTETRGHGGPTGELEVLRTAHMASGVAAKIDLQKEHVATGSVAIRTISAPSIIDLLPILDQLEAWWNNSVENDQSLAALDRILVVRDKQQIRTLEQQMRTDIQSRSLSKFGLCLADNELWESDDIEYIVNRQPFPISVPDESSIVTGLAAAYPIDPLSVNYRASISNRNSILTGKLYHLLSYETTIPGGNDTFIFEEGGWYQARSTWLNQVDNDVAQLVAKSQNILSHIALPDAVGIAETEDDYVARAHGVLSTDCLMMHRTLFPGSKLELCDLCHNGRVLFFVKKGRDRKACGDVSQQALQCANALVDSNQQFKIWADDHLASRGWSIDLSRRHEITFCIVLIKGKGHRNLSGASIRAKDALSVHMREIQKFGFNAAVKVV